MTLPSALTTRIYGAGELRSLDKQAMARLAATWGQHVRVYTNTMARSPIEQWFWTGDAWERVA